MANIFTQGAKAAWKLLTWAPEHVIGFFKAGKGKGRVGALISSGAILVASGFGIKSWYENREKHKEQEMQAAVPEAGELQANIRQNQVKLQQVSAELGKFNRQGNFREAIRGGNVAQGGQPDLN